MAKQYTADEMREIADEIGLAHDDIHEKAAAMLYQAADELEREEKYEYAVKWLDENAVANNMGEHREWAESIVRDVLDSKVRLVRREVGEWEEVPGSDGE